MADSERRAQQAAALAERRRKIEELRERRNRRETDTARVRAAANSNLDDYIDGLLSQPAVPGAPTAEAQETPNVNSVPSAERQSAETEKADDDKSAQSAASNVIAEPAPAPPPKVVETFAVSTQTDNDDFPEVEEPETFDEDAADDKDAAHEKKAPAVVVEEEEEEEEKDPKLLTEEEVEKEVASVPFSSFINTASKKVERMLGAPLLGDLLVDYVGEAETGEDRDQKDSDESRFLSSRQVFECEKWTPGRDVTDVDWSQLHRELLLSTYHMPQSASAASRSMASAAVSAVAPNDTISASLTPRSGDLQSDGLALVWSLTMPTRPEHVFTCGSPVTVGRFHPSESPLVIGGCETGQLVVWDVRAGRLPVQKSALTTVTGASSKAHVHPIDGMEVVEGGLGLVTSSTDGRVNFWSLANLREPAESTQVSDSVSCFAVLPESEGLLLGDDNGALFSVQSSSTSAGQRSSRKQVRKLDSTNESGENFGHYGMVTSVSAKTLKKGAAGRSAGLAKGFLRGSGGLVLSAGVDWTVKLWAPAYSDSPLVSMVSHSYDYMSDVMWCPNHPSLFATASSNGTVGLWNLASSFDEPVTGPEGLVIEPDAMSGRGLNKLKWSGDGRRLAVASADRLHVLTMTEEACRPKGDEDNKVMNHLMARGLISRQ